jgi:8-oxo-dGTP diphosphatase
VVEGREVSWVPLHDLTVGSGSKTPKKLAFDHALIITRARERLQERLNDPTPKNVFELVPPRFTLTELQRVYEAVFGRTLDKRNFRARLIARGLVEPVSAARRMGRHRPAQLYRWKQPRRR